MSLPEQKEAIERYASRNGLNIAAWFDEQQTAAKKGRPIWAKMLKLLRLGNASGVIIHKIDRSARNLKDWADLGELIDAGIEVHFANESLDLNSRGGRLSADIQAVVAADYIRNLREEAKKGIYGRLKQGFYPLRAPIGYLDNGQAKAKTIDPVKGPLIRKAFDLYRTTKFSIAEVCDEMFRLGLRNHTGTRVTPNGMSTILHNPFYMGVVRIRKTNQFFSGNHEALISKRMFEEVQDILAGRLSARPEKHDLLFRKLVKCNTCGYSLIGEIQKGHVYYRCHTSDCPTTGVREEVIHATVVENLRKLELTDEEKDYFASAIALLKQNWVEEQERHFVDLNVKLQKVSERLQRLTDVYLEQAIERSLFEERKAALLFERQEMQEVLRRLRDNPQAIPDGLQKFLELASGAYSLYQSAFLEKKRRLLKIVTSNFSVMQKTVNFAFVSPFRDVAEREKTLDGGPSKVLARTLGVLLVSLEEQFRVNADLVPLMADADLV